MRMMTTTPATRSIFVYGTLTAPEVLHTLVGRLPPGTPARLPGYTRHPVVGHVYPGIVPTTTRTLASTVVSVRPESVVPGILYSQLTASQLQILDWFEDRDYTRTDVVVKVVSRKEEECAPPADQPPPPLAVEVVDEVVDVDVATQVYVWTNPVEELDLRGPWDYERFRRECLADYLRQTVQPCRLEMERLGYISTATRDE
jgi:gamma-glutamylcyclotransferase (GGCT)/AIG2-like uncharacterized protein YtfP